ncbi:MAG: hypothetical protein AAF604_22265, partial [Acidobacteriota bacterium]
MAVFGYNIVRVFIDPGNWNRETGINGPWETGHLDEAYLDHFADFLLRATRHRLYVLPSIDGVPLNRHYWEIFSPPAPNIEGMNSHYLAPGHIAAKKAYLEDFIDALQARVGSEFLTSIFAYQLVNELVYQGRKLPFSSLTLEVTTANGKTYDMSDPIERQLAADENTILYTDTMVDAIRSRDPDAMVTIGMFTYTASGKPEGPNGLLPIPPAGEDGRFPVRPAVLSQSTALSFIDLHIYPGFGVPLEDDLASSEWSDLDPATPAMLGEYGALKNRHANILAGAAAMRSLQLESCAFGFSGWLYWAYDLPGSTWTLFEEGGLINQTVAPLYVPSPCGLKSN